MFLFLVLSQSEPPLGAPPKLWKKYEKHIDREKNTFRCFDKKKTINLSFLNDNYKDCEDGSDEPGTTAVNGTFYCRNERNTPKEIPKWDVSDGVCDCCDGSDEFFNPRVNCPNTCVDFENERKFLISELETIFEQGMNKQEEIMEKSMKMLEESRTILNQREKLEKLNETVNSLKEKIASKYESGNFEETVFTSIVSSIYEHTLGRGKGKKNVFKAYDESKLSNAEKKYNDLKQKIEEAENFTKTPEDLQMFISLNHQNFTKDNYNIFLLGKASDKYNSIGWFKEYKNHTLFYEGGDYCFVAKAPRRTEVETHCWNEHKLIEVQEPQPCVYNAVIASPVFCSAESFKKARNMTLSQAEEYKKRFSS